MPDTCADPYFSLPQLFFDQFQIQLKKRSSMYYCVEVSESGRGVIFIIWVHLDGLGPVGSLWVHDIELNYHCAVVSESGRGVIFK